MMIQDQEVHLQLQKPLDLKLIKREQVRNRQGRRHAYN
jgi:hypothetical protein